MTSPAPVHAFCDDALGHLDATGVAERIRRGEVSPAEACAAAAARAEAVQPLLNPVQLPDYDAALRGLGRTAGHPGDPAQDGPFDAPFAGVPTFVKDNVDVAGLPTQQGTDAFTARRAVRDSPVVTALRAAGLTVLGKSRLPEFGFNATTEYLRGDPVRNPWDPTRSAGASSGGAAVLVATGAVPVAHANDGGGSIRIPAAACGLVGLKPTRGRLVEDPADSRLPVRIVTQGVLTRSMRDTAGFLAAAEARHRNPALAPVRHVLGPGRTRLRVGVVLDSVTDTPTDDETRAAVLATADLLADLGHHVEDAALPVPARFADDFGLYWGLLGLLVTRTGRRILGPDFDPARTDELTRGLARMCRSQLPRVPGMVRRLRRTARDYRAAFTRHDVLLSPVVGHTTPLLGHLSPALPFEELFPRLRAYVGFTPLHNAAGGPALSLPLGRTGTGLPIGCQLSADHGDERTLLELGYELEEARPFPRIQDSADRGR